MAVREEETAHREKGARITVREGETVRRERDVRITVREEETARRENVSRADAAIRTGTASAVTGTVRAGRIIRRFRRLQ